MVLLIRASVIDNLPFAWRHMPNFTNLPKHGWKMVFHKQKRLSDYGNHVACQLVEKNSACACLALNVVITCSVFTAKKKPGAPSVCAVFNKLPQKKCSASPHFPCFIARKLQWHDCHARKLWLSAFWWKLHAKSPSWLHTHVNIPRVLKSVENPFRTKLNF